MFVNTREGICEGLFFLFIPPQSLLFCSGEPQFIWDLENMIQLLLTL